jgi:solute carrier family 50 protein (sugar transporter)
MDLLNVISSVAIVLTIGSFLTGTQICLKIWRKGSTADFTAFPFLAGILCTSLWLRYGLQVKDSTMIGVNTVGVSCFTSYLVFYYLFTLNKSTITKQILGLVLVLLSIVAFSSTTQNPVNTAGLFASASGLMFCAAPLAALADVVKSKSTEKLPFPLILSSFLVGSLWFLYGFLMNDAFIQVPNAIGAIISASQLSLFAMYPSVPAANKYQ